MNFWDDWGETVDGIKWERVYGLKFGDVDSTTAQLSASGEANLIYDSTLNNLYLSKNGSAYAAIGSGGGGSLTVEEQDGTPSVSDVTTIKVTNGTLTDDGSGVVSLDLGGTGGGTAITVPGLRSMGTVKYVRAHVGNMASGNNVLYTAPTGKRAMINAIRVYNTTGGSLSFYPTWVIGGTHYKWSGALSCGANSANQVATNYVIILEPGESAGINVNGTGMNGWYRVVEFDDSIPVYSAKKYGSWASGDNTLYTVPANTNALLIDNVGTAQQNITSLNYYNSSGGSRTITWYVVPSGGSAGSTNQVSPATAAGNDTRYAQIQATTMSSGDFVVINTNASTDTQLAWVNVMELPN